MRSIWTEATGYLSGYSTTSKHHCCRRNQLFTASYLHKIVATRLFSSVQKFSREKDRLLVWIMHACMDAWCGWRMLFLERFFVEPPSPFCDGEHPPAIIWSVPSRRAPLLGGNLNRAVKLQVDWMRVRLQYCFFFVWIHEKIMCGLSLL